MKGLIDVARNGYLWFLERTNGQINFVEGKPYVRQTAFTSLDPKTGRPEVDPARKPGTDKKADFCPSLWGGKNWPPISFNPRTRMIYIPANNNLCMSVAASLLIGEASSARRTVSRSTHSMFCRNFTDGTLAGREPLPLTIVITSGAITQPLDSTTARSIVFSSSRTFPGQ